MVYPAVNAFVAQEPGRCAPALSDMNNFTMLLNAAGSSTLSSAPSYASSRFRPGGGGNVLTPDTSRWCPATPGGLSTMSSHSKLSPNPPPSSGRGYGKGDHAPSGYLSRSRSSASTPGGPPGSPYAPRGLGPSAAASVDALP